MKKIILIAIMSILSSAAFVATATAGNCDHSWQQASDGSSCGGRAADQRAGGSDGY